MKKQYCLLISIILAIMPGAHAITMGISGGTGSQSFSSTASLRADVSDIASFSTVLCGDSIDQKFYGNGNMKENHSVTNNQGYYAEVATKIIDADKYYYSYTLTPKVLDHVLATQYLNVNDATYIHVGSKASNSRGDEAYASMEVGGGGINEYTSTVYADDKTATASQEVYNIMNAAFAEASTGAIRGVGCRPMLMDDEDLDAYANMKLKEGDIYKYSSSSSIDGSSAKANQLFNSDHSEYIESNTGTSNHQLNANSHKYNCSGACASTKARGGNLYLVAGSSSDINGTEVSQHTYTSYAKNIRSDVESYSKLGTYSVNDTKMSSDFIVKGAYAEANECEYVSMTGEAKAGDNGAKANQMLDSYDARHISSGTYAYGGNEAIQGNIEITDGYKVQLTEMTDGSHIRLRGDAHSNDNVRASQYLDVNGATYIHVGSKVNNSRGDEAYTSMEVREGDVWEYNSTVYADDKTATAYHELYDIGYAAFAEASTGATHWVGMEHRPMLDKDLDAYANMNLKEGGLFRYTSRSSIDGSSAKANQLFYTGHNPEHIESNTGATNHRLNANSHKYNCSGACARAKVLEGDLAIAAGSSSDINGTEVVQHTYTSYAKNIRSDVESYSKLGTYSANDTKMSSDFTVKGAYAEANESDYVSTSSKAKAGDNWAEAHQESYYYNAARANSGIYAYDANRAMQCNIEVTGGFNVGLSGDARSNMCSIGKSDYDGFTNYHSFWLKYLSAKAIDIKTSAYYRNDLGNSTSINKESHIDRVSLTSVNAHAQIDDKGPGLGIEYISVL